MFSETTDLGILICLLKINLFYLYTKKIFLKHFSFKKILMLSKLISHIQKDAGSDYDDEDIVVDDDDTAKNGLVNRNVNWRLSCWPLAMAASAFKKDTSLVLWNRAGALQNS